MIERRLLIFRMAAEVGNFTEAATALNMTQPNVTRQISLLEEELGVKLFERNGRGVEISAAGKSLLEETQRLISFSELIAGKVRCVARGVKPYRIGATMTAGAYVLPKLFIQFMKSHPDCHLDLHVDNTVEISEMLQEHLLDVALIEGPFDSNCFFSSHLLQDELKVVGRNGLKQPFRMADYLKKGGRFILREQGSGTRHYFYEYLRNNNLPRPSEATVVEANNFEAIKKMVQEGFGITVISELAIRDELESGIFTACTAAEGPILRDMNFIYLPGGKLKFAEKFIAFCRGNKKC